MKKNILALAVTSILSANAYADINDIFITEYVEGSDDNRAIEITNVGTTDFTFDDKFSIQYYDGTHTNTVKAPDGSKLLENVTVKSKKSIVILNNAAGDALKDALLKNIVFNDATLVTAASYSDQGFSSLNFSGKHEVRLVNDTTTIDTIGKAGEYWGSNKTFRLYSKNTDGNDPVQNTPFNAENWKAEATDTFDGLGIPDLEVRLAPPSGNAFEMLANETFREALARYAASGESVIITNDLNPILGENQGLYITRTYGFNFNSFRNNMTASYNGPNYQPNQLFVAGSADALKRNQDNIDNSLIIDSSSKASDGRLPYYPSFHTNAADNYIRINDTIINMSGVIKANTKDGVTTYTLTVNNILDNSNFKHNTPRASKPDLDISTPDDSFAIKVATQNVLNLFNSPFGGDQNLHADNRGAETDAEYPRQKEKLVEAIFGLNADIVGLMEIENNGFSDTGAIAEFVEAINAKYHITRPSYESKPEHENNKYVFIGFDSNGDSVLDNLDSIGSDAITSGIIYRPTKVSIESSKIIQMPQQHAPTTVNDDNVVVKDKNGDVLESGDNYMRDTVAATFVVNQTGKRLTVAVNHLKSKGSTCHEDWAGVDFGNTENYEDKAPDPDFQGQCENFRVAAAYQIGEELEKIGGDRVVLGDMNSYAKEDPMLVLTSNPTNKVLKTARDTFIGKNPQFSNSGEPVTISKYYGYISAVDKKDQEHGKESWSYSYNDEIGSLDHMLITPSLDSRLIDATDWHINAAESTYYDYNIVRMDSKRGLVPAKGSTGHDDFYAADAYRSSDHDSAIISLRYKYAESDGEAILTPINSGLMDVPYVIPTKADAKKGDVATIQISGANLTDVVIPLVRLTSDKQAFASFEIQGLAKGLYTVTMQLERAGKVVANSPVSVDIEAAKQDSLTPKIIIPEADGSGGSFGIFGILSLLGLGFLRRK